MEKNTETSTILTLNLLTEELKELTIKVSVLASNLDGQRDDYRVNYQKLESLCDDVKSVANEVDIFKDALHHHTQEEMEQMKLLVTTGFPDGDLSSHREFHKGEMEKRKNTAEIKKDVITHILKGVFWTAIVALGWAALYAFKGWITA